MTIPIKIVKTKFEKSLVYRPALTIEKISLQTNNKFSKVCLLERSSHRRPPTHLKSSCVIEPLPEHSALTEGRCRY